MCQVDAEGEIEGGISVQLGSYRLMKSFSRCITQRPLLVLFVLLPGLLKSCNSCHKTLPGRQRLLVRCLSPENAIGLLGATGKNSFRTGFPALKGYNREDMKIRKEKKSDIETIFNITKKAFENHPYSRQTEPFIINALRAAKALTLSLVCELEGKVVGHIAFSPATISDGSQNWYVLGPISVLPEFQKQGIGTALIQEGLRALKSLGAKGCVLVGEPEFYKKSGFENSRDLVFGGVPQQYVLALPLNNKTAHGQVTHHPAFSATG